MLAPIRDMLREWDRLDAANAQRAKLPPPNGRAPS